MFTKLRTALAVLALSAGVAGFVAPAASAHYPDWSAAWQKTYPQAVNQCYTIWPSSCAQVRYDHTSYHGDHTRVMTWTVHSSVHTRYWVIHYYVGHSMDIWHWFKIGVG